MLIFWVFSRCYYRHQACIEMWFNLNYSPTWYIWNGNVKMTERTQGGGHSWLLLCAALNSGKLVFCRYTSCRVTVLSWPLILQYKSPGNQPVFRGRERELTSNTKFKVKIRAATAVCITSKTASQRCDDVLKDISIFGAGGAVQGTRPGVVCQRRAALMGS